MNHRAWRKNHDGKVWDLIQLATSRPSYGSSAMRAPFRMDTRR